MFDTWLQDAWLDGGELERLIDAPGSDRPL